MTNPNKIKKSTLLAEIEVLTDMVRALEKRVAELEARPFVQFVPLPETQPQPWTVPLPHIYPTYPNPLITCTYTTNTTGEAK